MLNAYAVSWHDEWSPQLDECLAALPERECMPHALYRQLLNRPGDGRRRIALVRHRGVPVMLAGLRRRSRYVWEPIANWHAPGPAFPVAPGHIGPALRSISLEIPIAWWRTGMEPPSGWGVRSVETSPTYRLRLDGDPEKFWRETGYLRTIRNMRNRCKGFTVAINHPGAAAWTIRQWSQKWSGDGDGAGRTELDERIEIAEDLEKRGKHISISVFDNGQLVGGSSNFVHEGDLVAGVIYHEPQYRANGLGVRIIDLAFEVGTKRALKAFDLGGKADYKKKWAPEDGTRSRVVVAPLRVQYMRKVASTVRALAGRSCTWMLLSAIHIADYGAIGRFAGTAL